MQVTVFYRENKYFAPILEKSVELSYRQLLMLRYFARWWTKKDEIEIPQNEVMWLQDIMNILRNEMAQTVPSNFKYLEFHWKGSDLDASRSDTNSY